MEFTNELATILVIGLVVAVIIELLKHTKLNEKLSGLLVDLLTLLLGLVGGLIAMYLTDGLFSDYVGIGLIGGAISSKIYTIISNLTNGKFTKKVGE